MEAAVRRHQRARLSTTLTPAARDTCSPCPHLHMAYRRAWRSTWTHAGVHLSWECIYTCIETADGAFCAVVFAENVILHTCTRLCNSNSEYNRKVTPRRAGDVEQNGLICRCVGERNTYIVFLCHLPVFHSESLMQICLFCTRSAEIDQKLQEIMKQTGYLKIDGQVRSEDLDIWCLSSTYPLQVITMSKSELELTRQTIYEEKHLCSSPV